MGQEQYGTTTPVYNKLYYDIRGQLAEIRESTTPNDTSWNRGAIINQYSNNGWGAGSNGTDNNGNLQRQEVYVPANDQVSSYTNWVQYYSYDALNRLSQVHEVTGNAQLDWLQTYTYDQWGNRQIDYNNTTPGTPRPQFTIDGNTNRLGVPGGQTGVMSYDAAGNLQTDTYSGSGSRSYDAENRMATADGVAGASRYAYDADGKRVRRNSYSDGVWQVYGMDGELLAEYLTGAATTSALKEYGYRNGQVLVTASNATAVNYALTGTATESSTFSGISAARAVDNNTDGAIWDGHASVTNYESHAWWQEDAYGHVLSIYGTNAAHARLKVSSPIPTRNSIKEEDRIQNLISSLSSRDNNISGKAEKELISLARTSPQQRQRVIQALLESVEQHDNLRDGTCVDLGPTIFFWSSATTIFAELKASEAIDVMIKDIYCGSGLSGNSSLPPSVDALIQMGALAVPKLSEALRHESITYKRGLIVGCLGTIGGPRARLALNRALRTETNADVIWSIKHSLSTMPKKSH